MLTHRWSAEGLDKELARRNPVPGLGVDDAARSAAATALLRHIFDMTDGESTPAEAGAAASPVRSRWSTGTRPRRPVRKMATMLALVALAAGCASAIVATVDRSAVPRRTTTRWLAARPLTARSTARQGPAGVPNVHAAPAWELVGDLVPAGWKLGTPGPGPGMVTCPTTTVCYVTGDTATSASGPSVLGGLYVSTDGASSWSVLALPAGFSFSSELTCVSALACAAGGMEDGTAVFAETRDGGHRWTVTTTGAAGGLVDLTCVSAIRCMALSVAPSEVEAVLNGPTTPRPLDEQFARTTDGGNTWAVNALPATVRFSALQCTSGSSCVAIGAPVDTGATTPRGVALWTDDGGLRWWHAALPAGVGFDDLSALSCSSSAHCMAIATRATPNPSRCSTLGKRLKTATTTAPTAAECSSGATIQVSTILSTSDGGATWQAKSLPASVPQPQLDAVACSAPETCWATGTEAVPSGNSPGSPVLLGTTNGGTSWTAATVAVPANAPNDQGGDAYMAVGSISCPSPAVCVALGIVDQGARFAPVYRMDAAP